MQTVVALGMILAGPALFLVLARYLGGERSVQILWTWALRWIYGIGLVAAVGLLAVVWTGGIEGDDAFMFAMASAMTLFFGLSGLVTWLANHFLTARRAIGA